MLPLRVTKHDEPGLKALHRYCAGDLLIRLQLQEIHNRLPARSPAQRRNLIDFEPVGLAFVCKEEQIVLCRGGKYIRYELLALGFGADNPPPAATLHAVSGERLAFDVSGAGNGHCYLLFLDEIFLADLALDLDDLCPALISVIIDELGQLFFDDAQDLEVAGKDLSQAGR